MMTQPFSLKIVASLFYHFIIWNYYSLNFHQPPPTWWSHFFVYSSFLDIYYWFHPFSFCYSFHHYFVPLPWHNSQQKKISVSISPKESAARLGFCGRNNFGMNLNELKWGFNGVTFNQSFAQNRSRQTWGFRGIGRKWHHLTSSPYNVGSRVFKKQCLYPEKTWMPSHHFLGFRVRR